MNLERAKKIINELSHYVKLTEEYKPKDLETQIIHEYAIYGSISKVVKSLNQQGYTVKKEDITRVLKSKPEDELHSVIRGFYKDKVSTIKNRSY
ncbi:hypothetical protein J6TS2_33810 [Heyndrickxia sporothermodurans]|nr:hypothetical protein J6TS2_33810 [Heyndrickxia sporothermodurans]